MADVLENLRQARARIDAACSRAGRDTTEVELLPVSKTHPDAAVRRAAGAGYRRFGENRPQEVARRAAELADLDLSWVAIGRVQTNKAKLIAEHAAELQSLDSVALGEALERRLDALGRTLPVLVQVNTSGEAAKAGFCPEDTPAAVATLRACPHLEVRGLMTMAAHTTDRDAIRSSFACLRDLRDRLRDVYGPELGALSMGMSGDFELAVEEGATCVRLGSVIFGTRPAQA